MENIVYFLGAGCSKNFGYPLTGDIMPAILMNLKKHNLFRLGKRKTHLEKEQEKDLDSFMKILYPGLIDIDLEKERYRIPSVVEVLSFVEHLCFYNIPPHPRLNEEKLIYFRYLLNRSIAELMMDYQNMKYKDGEEELLDKFIESTSYKKNEYNISFITTNYDLSIDPKFTGAIDRKEVDYGISYRDPYTEEIVSRPTKPKLSYFKLHGSLNWLKCELCGQFYIHPDGNIAHLAFKKRLDDTNTCICNDDLKLKAVLVTPSIVRDIRDSNLLQIWKASSEAIRVANKIIFIGYSLPSEDLAIKALIMRGLNGKSKRKKLVVDVVQYGQAAKPNYINLFGKDVNYYDSGLDKYLGA